MAFRVEVTAKAKHDANAILEWLLGQEAGEAGMRWFERLQEALGSLANFTRTLSVGR